jgi:hypothetical protein
MRHCGGRLCPAQTFPAAYPPAGRHFPAGRGFYSSTNGIGGYHDKGILRIDKKILKTILTVKK